MATVLKASFIVLSLVSAPVAFAVAPAVAADNVTISAGPGGFAFGYTDGYWDRDRKWHEWRNREEAEHFRAENREHYYERKHDREREGGWRDSDRYWERH